MNIIYCKILILESNPETAPIEEIENEAAVIVVGETSPQRSVGSPARGSAPPQPRRPIVWDDPQSHITSSTSTLSQPRGAAGGES